MKKIIVLIISLFLLSGCSIDCHLDVTNNTIKETTTIESIANENQSKSLIYEQYSFEYPIYNSEEFLYYSPTEKKEGCTYYDKSIEDIGNGYRMTYVAEYRRADYTDSRFLNTAFASHSIGYDSYEHYYYIIASNAKLLDSNDVNNIKVTITLRDMVSVENNADSVIGYNYIWNISSTSKNIVLKYKKNNNIETKEEEKDVNNSTVVEDEEETNIMLVFFILAGFFMVLAFIIKFSNIKKQ